MHRIIFITVPQYKNSESNYTDIILDVKICCFSCFERANSDVAALVYYCGLSELCYHTQALQEYSLFI